MIAKRYRTRGGNSIRVSPVLGRQCFYEFESLKTVQGAVKGSGTELQAREVLDVQDQCVSVFRPVGKARENQNCCLAGTAQNLSTRIAFGFASRDDQAPRP